MEISHFMHVFAAALRSSSAHMSQKIADCFLSPAWLLLLLLLMLLYMSSNKLIVLKVDLKLFLNVVK
jgi:hypothetical protein